MIKFDEKIRVIGFDADDTLWDNLPLFLDTGKLYCELLSEYADNEVIQTLMDANEQRNIDVFGYGTKSFMLSMIETAYEISDGEVDSYTIKKMIDLGKKQIKEPIVLLNGVEEVVRALGKKYRLVVATKGDLMEQERKLARSGLAEYFHHVEVMSEKRSKDYARLLKHLDIAADEFLMVGNSLKSDILPVLEIGGWAVHVPYHTTWVHEQVEGVVKHDRMFEVESIRELV
ncbi:HAD family hydrolase [Planctomycetota bacterium]|nr:HAD family hydrolase [Planctomycetota bacterium]